ncbi:hypothetical protein DM02DRAFT_608793 [Periconia macrospinosa]|uniref:Lipid droplet-associated hydrolase n=1 Tax=Periconia macrospinosa TaxID=97972 RepID=A0A2V1EB07_9PLEO|nr:hypothetical protein DM02DRAFT_608793 [Periconia macrospinosa]
MSTSLLHHEIHLQQQAVWGTKSPLRTYIIYFITGNPGLIGYYRNFLTHLYGLLSTDTIRVHIYGRSLSGFEVDPVKATKHAPPYSLEDQILHSTIALEEQVRKIQEEDSSQDTRVILMGHSVGAYILLEVTRRMMIKAKAQGGVGVRVVGGICLFPTITHIAKSSSGRKSSWFLTIRHFAFLASLFVRLLTFPIPIAILAFLIRAFMRFPADAARVTAAFVKSRNGVQQALHMARDEMLEITTDNWSEEIWSAADSQSGPILRFLFAKSDHWVADETRDELIAARAANPGNSGRIKDEDGDGRPIMEIDELEGWPHGFCLKHSIPVAEHVAGYVKTVFEKDSK